jgi:hypothetical protein
MKKLLVVLSVLFVVALIAGSAFAASMYDPENRAAKLAAEKAAPIKIGGEFTFGAITDFTPAEGTSGYYNMYTDVTLWPDDFNSFMFRIAGSTPADWSDNSITVPYWEWTTDIGKALDLPVTLKATAGKTSLWTRKYEVSGLAYERPVRPNIDPLPWKVAIGTDKFTVTAAIGFSEGLFPTNTDADNDIGVLVAIPAIGPASAELFYLAMDNADMKGTVGFNVQAMGLLNEMLDIAAGFSDNLATETWAYGIGANVKYNKIRAAVSINGNDVDAISQLGIDAAFAATDMFGIDAAVGLNLTDVGDTFQGAEFSGYAMVGVSKWSIGYQIKDGTAFNYVPAVANTQGGLFVAVDTNF